MNKLHTRVCSAIAFERYDESASREREYVDRCYRQVQTQMQQEIDRLVEERESDRANSCLF